MNRKKERIFLLSIYNKYTHRHTSPWWFQFVSYLYVTCDTKRLLLSGALLSAKRLSRKKLEAQKTKQDSQSVKQLVTFA